MAVQCQWIGFLPQPHWVPECTTLHYGTFMETIHTPLDSQNKIFQGRMRRESYMIKCSSNFSQDSDVYYPCSQLGETETVTWNPMQQKVETKSKERKGENYGSHKRQSEESTVTKHPGQHVSRQKPDFKN